MLFETTADHAALRAAERALATASKPISRKPSALDRVTAAADAFMQGEFARANAAHTAAEEAAVRWDDGLKQKREAAAAAVLVPAELCFPVNPAEEVVKMELHFADGSVRTTDMTRRGYTPATHGDLIAHCHQQGLKAPPLLKVWKKWKNTQAEAADAVMPEGWHLAQQRFEEAESDWNRALDKQMTLACAIVNVRVKTAADALRQVDAYGRTMGLADPTFYADHEDALIIASSLIKSLRVMAGQVTQ